MRLSKLSFWSCCCFCAAAPPGAASRFTADLAEDETAFAVESASAAIVAVSAFYSVGPPAGETEER